MGDLLQALLGPIAQAVEFLSSLVPRFTIIRANERGVLYPGGSEPRELEPGVRWWLPVLHKVVWHSVARQVVDVRAITVESLDGLPVSAGMVVTYRVSDVLAYEVQNYDAEVSLSEVAEGALRKLLVRLTLEQLQDHRQGLDDKLATAVAGALAPFGVEVESARLTDHVRLTGAYRLFGVDVSTSIGVPA